MSTLKVTNLQNENGTSPAITISVGGTVTVSELTSESSTYTGIVTAQSGINVTGGSINIGTGTSISSPESNVLALGTNNTEQLRIDSSGRVGVGTSTPGYRLDVTSQLGCTYSGALRHLVNIDSDGGKSYWYNGTPTTTAYVIGDTGSAYFAGNIGIGTASPLGTLHTSGNSANLVGAYLENRADAGSSDSVSLNFVLRRAGGFQFGIPAIKAVKENAWTTTPSTINDSLTFSTIGNESSAERMRIDSSGRLLVGTSSAPTGTNTQYSKLGVFGNSSSATTGLLSLSYGAAATGLSNAFNIGRIFFGDTGAAEFGYISCEVDGTSGSGDYPGRLVFATTADGASSPTERMRITSDGFLRATTTGSYGATNGHNFAWDNATRFLLKHTSATAGDNFGLQVNYAAAAPNNTQNEFLYCSDSTSTRFIVRSNGGLANYQANDINLCDEREKKNIETLDSTWGCLKHWDLKKFHYNEDADTDDKRYGVIAQQIALHCPEVISDWVKQKAEDAVLDDDGNVVTPAVEEVTRMAVKEQQMMWMAIKALQEAQTRIETLEAEVAALKGA